jgi:thiamine-phosphate pyrophosphorylase
MRIVVISPEAADPREVPALEGLFAAGLDRYHVRKPDWPAAEVEAWLRTLPVTWRPRLVLHGHAALATQLGLAGTHVRDGAEEFLGSPLGRSCHDLPTLRRRLGSYATLIFGPVFPSLSKPGYGPAPDFPWEELTAALAARTRAQAQVIAIGGVTEARLPRCAALGFDGAAVLGAVWGAADPVQAYASLCAAAARLERSPHAA